MDGSSGLLIAGKLIAVMVLVLANGFFVAAEFSLVSMRRSRIGQLIEEGHPQAKTLQRAVNSLDTYLAATQLGITMASLALGWLGEPAVAAVIEPAFHFLPENLATLGSNTLAVVIAFTIITALHIVLGELAPKSLALQRPEETALFSVKPLELYLAIFRPAIVFLNSLGNFVLVLLGLQTGTSEEFIHSPEELRLLVSASHKAGLLGDVEEDVVERVFRVGEQRVSAFMTPRREITWLDISEPLNKLEEKITSSVYSRFLVCEGSIDHPLGLIGAKEFLAARLARSPIDLAALLTHPLYVPESMRALNTLDLFRKSGSYLAVVIDEYGVMQGLVSLNDILEAIVGDIHTGNEPTEPQALQCEDGSWLLDGMLAIEEFKDLLSIRHLPEGEGVEYQTVGGFVLTQLGHIPIVNERFDWDKLCFQITAMDGHRVDKVLVMPSPKGGVNESSTTA